MVSDRGHILSVDIGGSTCKIGHVTEDGDVFDVSRHPTESIRSGGPEALLQHLRSYTEDHSIHGVAIGIPATVDWEHNHVRSQCEEVPWLEDSSNKKVIQDKLKRPLLLVNDVEANLLGEWFWGELKGYTSGVVLSLGESMGSALLWNGSPQQGRRGSIMELEHVSLDTYGDTQDSFPPGSSHAWISGEGLRTQLSEQGIDGEVQDVFSTESNEYREIRSRFEDKLAHLLGIVVMMLDPERIVITGGLTGSADEWLPEVEKKMDRYVMEQFQGLPSITLGQLCGDDVVKGPAAFWDWVQREE